MAAKGVIYVDQMFNSGSTASATLTSLFPGTTAAAGTYSPQLSGTLIKIGVFVTASAVSSLCYQARVELSQTNWSPNVLRFPFAGSPIATAPLALGGSELLFEFVVNQPVQTDWPITGNMIEYFTAVTPAIVVYGYFSA